MKYFVVVDFLLIAIMLVFIPVACLADEGRPSIMIGGTREDLQAKIESEPWARVIYDDIVQSVQPYVDQHKSDPEWIVSRLQMHWKTQYARTFVNGQVWSHGEGRAPVPTVRFAGGRDWAVPYATPSLEDVRPYDEDPRGIWLQNRKKPGEPWEWAPVNGTGQIIERINERIMGLAEKAAFLYWYTGDEMYAKLASDILWTYAQGMYHRANPETFENHRNARIIGLATFEVIHEGVTMPLAVAYDFLRGYLVKMGKDTDLMDSLLKRWADRIIEGGGARGNWNLNQARFIVYMGLALEPNATYSDDKGREHYIAQFTDVSSKNQTALKDVVPQEYDQETGIWAEAPGYAFSVTDNILRLSHVIRNATNKDVVDAYPVLEKAALVMFQYLFPNNHTVGFGDTYHQTPNPMSLEMLIARARYKGDVAKERQLTAVLNRQMAQSGYRRDRSKSLFALTAYVGNLMDVKSDTSPLATRTFHGPPVSLLIQRNGDDPKHGLMASLAGTKGGHMHANGMALELYGQGMVLGPDMGRGSSYWQKEHGEYYRQFPAHNTVIVDGASDYRSRDDHPFKVLDLEPASEARALSEWVSFSDTAFDEPKTASDQRRLVSVVRTLPTSGFYVDIFRSGRRDGKDQKNEYLYHNLGQRVDLMDADGLALVTSPTEELGTAQGDLIGYDYFTEKQVVSHNGDFSAVFQVALKDEADVAMRMWMAGAEGRTVFTAMSPQARSILHGSAPRELRGNFVPMVIVRHPGEVWTQPFAAVFEPFGADAGPTVSRIQRLDGADGFVGLKVASDRLNGHVAYVFNDLSDETTHQAEGMTFQGIYGVACVDADGLQYLYLGKGKRFSTAEFEVVGVEGAVAVCLYREGDGFRVSCSGPVRVRLPEGEFTVPAGYGQRVGTH
jgi:hypothetical protein